MTSTNEQRDKLQSELHAIKNHERKSEQLLSEHRKQLIDMQDKLKQSDKQKVGFQNRQNYTLS